MIEAWIPITIAAAFFQNLRSALQKHLTGRLSANGAAYARFLYALPLSVLYVVALHRYAGFTLPEVHGKFLLYCLLGGVSQILFTVFLLRMFAYRSFAVGTTFSKLEVVMVALLGALLLGDTLGPLATLAIGISALGVVALNIGASGLSPGAVLASLMTRPSLLGFVCAAWLGASVVFFRGASLSLTSDSFIIAAGFTLMVSLVLQTLIMGVYLLVRERGEFTRVLANWRWASLVGITGMLASVGWFTAFTLVNAGFVRALGQVELVFTYLATVFVFRERISGMETLGIVLIGAAIVLIVLAP